MNYAQALNERDAAGSQRVRLVTIQTSTSRRRMVDICQLCRKSILIAQTPS